MDSSKKHMLNGTARSQCWLLVGNLAKTFRTKPVIPRRLLQHSRISQLLQGYKLPPKPNTSSSSWIAVSIGKVGSTEGRAEDGSFVLRRSFLIFTQRMRRRMGPMCAGRKASGAQKLSQDQFVVRIRGVNAGTRPSGSVRFRPTMA